MVNDNMDFPYGEAATPVLRVLDSYAVFAPRTDEILPNNFYTCHSI